MSYGSYAASLSSDQTNITNNLNTINQTKFDGWEGKASKKITTDIKTLGTSLTSLAGAIGTLSSTLNDIDTYDAYEKTISTLETDISNLDKSSSDYPTKYSSLTSELEEVKRKKTDIKTSITTALSGLKTDYSSTSSEKTYNNSEKRFSILDEIDNINQTINTNLNMKKTVDKNTLSTSNGNVDTSKYHNNEANGFVVTTNNKVYNLSDADYDIICATVAAESDKSYDDALAVASVILNRCENDAWIRSHGTNPVDQAKAPGQFVVWEHGYAQKYTGGNSPQAVKEAVRDALNGTRNNKYMSFRSNGTTSYSNNMITNTGNRYK